MTNAKPADGTFDVPADRSRAVAAHRAHQSAWREEVLAWPPGPPTNPVARKRYERLGSCLAEQHDGQKPKHAGVNLMSPDAVEYAKTRVRELEGLGGLAETDRLWRNLLSSQPLAFSITGELRAHHEAAARVFAALTGLPVESMDVLEDAGSPSHHLDGSEAEWFPPRELHTADQSGFDIAAYLRLNDGQHLLITVEVKYTDTFSPKKVTWPRYRQHLEAAGLDRQAMDSIVAAGGSQFLRSVMLTDSLRRQGLRGGPGVGRTLAVVLARGDDTSAKKVVAEVARHHPHTPVAYWSHEEFLRACGEQRELAEWGKSMQRRYVLPD